MDLHRAVRGLGTSDTTNKTALECRVNLVCTEPGILSNVCSNVNHLTNGVVSVRDY